MSQSDHPLEYYSNTGTKYLYIFNHEEYQNTKYFSYGTPPIRIGTNEDVRRLTEIFKNLDYKVAAYHNFTHDQIMDTILSLSKKDHKDTSCLCFAFLTHGEKGGSIYAADRIYQIRDVISPLAHGHDSLVGVPKIYFVQACRGKFNDYGRRLQLDGERSAFTIPIFADFLMLHSSVEDFVSYRKPSGSIMIQELCNVIEKYHDSLDILHMLTLVQKIVAYECIRYVSADRSVHEMKQMPETRHTLTKMFKF